MATIAVYVSGEVEQLLKQTAKIQDRSVSWLIKKAVKDAYQKS